MWNFPFFYFNLTKFLIHLPSIEYFFHDLQYVFIDLTISNAVYERIKNIQKDNFLIDNRYLSIQQHEKRKFRSQIFHFIIQNVDQFVMMTNAIFQFCTPVLLY